MLYIYQLSCHVNKTGYLLFSHMHGLCDLTLKIEIQAQRIPPAAEIITSSHNIRN